MSEGEPPHVGRLRAIIVSSIILLPVVIWIVFISWGETRCTPLPLYKYTNERGDSVVRVISHYEGLVDQRGKPFTTVSLKGKVHIATFIYTTCPATCPMLTQKMVELWDKQKQMTDVSLVAYSVDPAVDTPKKLSDFARQQKATDPAWTFVTGDSASLASLIRKDYLQPYQLAPGGVEKITHSNMAVLVDNDMRIRGFYNVLDAADLKKLEEELNVLRCEYREKEK